MTATSTTHDGFLSRANRAALHVRIGGAWTARVKRDADAQAPAGGVSSTVRDLARWVRLELGDGRFEGRPVVAAAALAETHAPLTARGRNPVTGAAAFYGLGWNVEFGRHGLVWGHAGAFSVGAQTLVSLHPGAKLGVVVLTNAFPSGVPEGLADSLMDLVFDGRIGRDWVKAWGDAYRGLFAPAVAAARAAYGTPPSPAMPALPLAAYAGRYANAYVGTAVVTVTGSTLSLTLGPDGARTYPLRHFDRDRFLYDPDPETPDLPAAVRFAIGSGGRADAVTLEPLDASGLGTLTRATE